VARVPASRDGDDGSQRGGPAAATVVTTTASPPLRKSRVPRTFLSLQDKEFRWFYLAMLGQMAAMNMQLVVRGFLAFYLTGSYAVLGLVGLAGGLPMLLLSMFGGVLADRLPKRTVLQGGQALSLLNAVIMAALVFADQMTVTWLLLGAFAQGVVMALMMPARQAMIPDIVGMERLMNAVALNQAGMNSMRLLAPAAGGFIVSFAGFDWAFMTMAALYGVAIVGMLRVTWKPAVSPGTGGESAKEIWLRSILDIRAGLSYVSRDRVMFTLLAVSFISSLFGMPYLFLLPGYVADIFGGDGFDIGLLIGISAVGSLVGSLVLASLPDRNRGILLLGGTLTLAIGLVLFTLTDSYWIGALFMVIVGLGSAMRQALSQGLLQAYVENEYRGRVMSLFMTQFSVMQLGTFFIGVAAEFIGIRLAFALLGAGLIVVTAAVFVFVPRIRQMR
jgi:MFS family permease